MTFRLLLLSVGSEEEAIRHAIGGEIDIDYQGEPSDIVDCAPVEVIYGLSFEELEDTLDYLDQYGNPHHARSRPNFVPSQLGAELETPFPLRALGPFAACPFAPPALLWRLAFHPVPLVRIDTAQNPNAPALLLRWLAREFPREVAQNPVFPLLRLEDPAAWEDLFRTPRPSAPPSAPGLDVLERSDVYWRASERRAQKKRQATTRTPRSKGP
jgi:hypothetical protein